MLLCDICTISKVAASLKELLIRPCKISISMKANVSVMCPRCEAD